MRIARDSYVNNSFTCSAKGSIREVGSIAHASSLRNLGVSMRRFRWNLILLSVACSLFFTPIIMPVPDEYLLEAGDKSVFVLEDYVGEVVAVSGGDTIKVLHNEKSEWVRLNGVDCPEKDQAYGLDAKRFTADFVSKTKVIVNMLDFDMYGRTVGEVTLSDGRSLNRELVKAGLAWWYRKYSPDQSLGALEAGAKEARRGLWSDPDPMSPWEWRKRNKEES